MTNRQSRAHATQAPPEHRAALAVGACDGQPHPDPLGCRCPLEGVSPTKSQPTRADVRRWVRMEHACLLPSADPVLSASPTAPVSTPVLNTTRSQEIFTAAQTLMPGGVSSPVRAFKSVGGQPIVFERVKGAYAWDVDGNRYIDYVGS